jgi:hypothetical protein
VGRFLGTGSVISKKVYSPKIKLCYISFDFRTRMLNVTRQGGSVPEATWIATGLAAFAMTKPHWIAALRSR